MGKVIRSLILLLAALVPGGSGIAQTYPAKPIRIIVGFPPGTIVDIVSRALAVHMQKQLGQPILVEARPGAGGAIAANAVVKAEPDGYTFHLGVLASLIPALVKNNPIDARKDLAAISDIYSSPLVFFSSGKLPVRSFQDLLAFAKANPPNTLNVASSISQIEIVMQLVKHHTGLTYTLVNYSGAPTIIPAMLSGEIATTFNVFGPFLPHLGTGAIRVLFVTGSKRMSQFPHIPTAAEVGIPNVEAATFDGGFWAPRGTPRDIIEKLNRAAVYAIRMPDVADLFQKQAYEAIGSTPEEQLRKYEASTQFWAEAAKRLNYEPR